MRRIMKKYKVMSKTELCQEKQQLEERFADIKAKGLQLDMSRGKPAVEQLDFGMKMLDVLNSTADLNTETGFDTRNYGLLDGIPEAKRLIGEILGVSAENVMVYGNSSLNIMYDTVARSMTHGVMGSTPWCKLDKVKFLCPVPGYDRHFAVTEHFGIEMINIPMTPKGPDMDMVAEYVNNDPAVKGIWCVPKYSNPQGITYSDETVERFAKLQPAAEDFRIYWDNAYVQHYLDFNDKEELVDILGACEKAGQPDMVYEFCSTSKIIFAGGGIAAMASSKANLDYAKKQMNLQTIGYDKVNQLRHVRYFKDIKGIEEHMNLHAASLKPKFETVLQGLDKELGGLDIGTWIAPKGGYFISFESLTGCAKAIVAKAREAGLVMTSAGATYPYGDDVNDSNIRIAPSFPTSEELKIATDIFVTSVKLISVQKMLSALDNV